MDKLALVLNWLVLFIGTNPVIVLTVFTLCIVANIVQISTYLRDRRHIKKQDAEQRRLAILVDTYEDVLRIAKDTVADKDALHALKQEIREKSEVASDLRNRIGVLERAAQHGLVTQAIEYNLQQLTKAHAEVERLRDQYNELGELPDLDPDIRKQIETEVKVTITSPYELPPEFMFKSVLLVLFLFLLPWPVDKLLMPFLLRFFMATFFDTAALFPSEKVKTLIAKYYSLIVFLATLGVWNSFFHAIVGTANTLLPAFRSGIGSIIDLAIWPCTLIFAIIDWRRIRRVVREEDIPRLVAKPLLGKDKGKNLGVEPQPGGDA